MDTITTLILTLHALLGALDIAEMDARLDSGYVGGLAQALNGVLVGLGSEERVTEATTAHEAWSLVEHTLEGHEGLRGHDRVVYEALREHGLTSV